MRTIGSYECNMVTKWYDIMDLTLILVDFIDDYIILYGVTTKKYYAIHDNF